MMFSTSRALVLSACTDRQARLLCQGFAILFLGYVFTWRMQEKLHSHDAEVTGSVTEMRKSL